MDIELERWKAAGKYFDYLGFNIFYRTEGSGPTLLVIHGYPFNTWDWAPLWDRLTARFTVVAPDMLGMGFSDKPVAYGYSVHDHADMHEALLVHLGVKSAHILAHDTVTRSARSCSRAACSPSRRTGHCASSRSRGSTAAFSTRPIPRGCCRRCCRERRWGTS